MMKALRYLWLILFLACPCLAQNAVPIVAGNATINPNTQNNSFKIIVTSAVTVNISTLYQGSSPTLTILFAQDATGHTVTFGSSFASASAPTIPTTANSYSSVSFQFDGSTNSWYGLQGSSGSGTGTVTDVTCVSGCTVANGTTTPAITVTAGGGNTTSTSLTTGYLPKASGANAIVNSAADDGITTASTLTYSGSGGINASGGPITAGGSTSGLSLACITPATPASGYLGITVASTCTNYGNYNFQALPASAGLLHAAAISSHVSAVTVSPVVSADLNITGTTCTNQVLTAISSAAAGTCANVTGSQMTANTVTATQLAAQYSKRPCEIVWGGSGTSFALTSGDDAIANYSCRNGLGVTETIASIYCTSDNGSNTTTINPTFGATGTGTTMLSGALTCGSSGADSSAGSISNSSYVAGAKINPVMGGTLTGTQIHVYVNFTY